MLLLLPVGFLVVLQTPEDMGLVPPRDPLLLDGPVGQDVVEFEMGNGAELCVAVEDVPTPVPELVLVTTTGPVPVGPVLAVVELGQGYDAELDRVEDRPGPPVLQLDEGTVPVPVPVPPVPVGPEVLEFEIGYGALLVEIPGAVPVPCVPELAGTEGPPDVSPLVLVRFMVGYGAEVVGRVELLGAVPDVGKAQVLELDTGKGIDVLAVPVDPVGTPVPEEIGPLENPVLPVGPAAELELLIGKGADEVDGKRLPEELCTGVPNEPVPVGPARLVEFEIGKGVDDESLPERGALEVGTPVPVPVGPTQVVEEFLDGNGTPVPVGLPEELAAEDGVVDCWLDVGLAGVVVMGRRVELICGLVAVSVTMTVTVLTVVLRLATMLLILDPVMASTLDVSNTGGDVVLSIEDEGPELAAEVDPSPVEV